MSAYKKSTSLLLAGLFLVPTSGQADWIAVDAAATGSAYQAVLSPDQARTKGAADQGGAARSVSGGHSSLSLTKPDEAEQLQRPLTAEEKERVLGLLKEIASLADSVPNSQADSNQVVASDQGGRLETAEPGKVRPAEDSQAGTPVSADTQDARTVQESHLPGIEGQRNMADEPRSGDKPGRNEDFNSDGIIKNLIVLEDAPAVPYQKGPSLFDFKEAHVSYLPTAVQETGVEVVTSTEVPSVDSQDISQEQVEMRDISRGEEISGKTALIGWLITLLDNFEMFLGPQEIEKQSLTRVTPEIAAASGPSITQGQLFPNPWMVSILGAAAEILRFSAEQLRDWLYEAEAFDQGSLYLKVSMLHKAVNFLLVTGNQNLKKSSFSEQGYRLVNAVNVDQELAALHILANPPRVHPFVRHVLFETQAIPEKLKRYWLDVEKLKAIYAKAGTTDANGNVYLIRYKGQILKNPYRPMPDDMGGRYELVIAE